MEAEHRQPLTFQPGSILTEGEALNGSNAFFKNAEII